MEFDDLDGVLDGLVQNTLARMGAEPLSRGRDAKAYTNSKLSSTKERINAQKLAPASSDEIQALAIQQAQWEATAYAEASDILQRAHQQADVERRAVLSKAEAEAADLLQHARVRAGQATGYVAPVDYHGRHQVSGKDVLSASPGNAFLSNAATQLLPIVIEVPISSTEARPVGRRPSPRRRRCPGKQATPRSAGAGQDSAERRRGGPDSWLGSLDELRPMWWTTVRNWFNEVGPEDADRLTFSTFTWAEQNLDQLPESARYVDVETWLRAGAKAALRTRHRVSGPYAYGA